MTISLYASLFRSHSRIATHTQYSLGLHRQPVPSSLQQARQAKSIQDQKTRNDEDHTVTITYDRNH